MADNNQIKQHISAEERAKWDKVVDEFNNHHGKGDKVHPLGNGKIPGFSTNDFTDEMKAKIDSFKEYTHPTTHPASMITGLAKVAISGSYNDLSDKPTSINNATRVGGIRFTIAANQSAISNPINDKEVWFDMTNLVIKVYSGNKWIPMRAVFG